MKTLLLLLSILLPELLSGAQRIVGVGGGNVNAGGTYVGGVAPGTTDTVICAITSGGLTINLVTTIGKLDCQSGYVGTLTMTFALTVGGDITLQSGMGISGSSGLSMSATGTIASNGKTWPNAFTTSGTSTTKTLSSKFTVTGLVTVSGTTAITFTGDTLFVNGGVTGTVNTSGTTLFYLQGGTCTYSGSTLSNNVVVNGSVTIAAFAFAGSSFKYLSGSVTCNNTVTVSTNSTFDTNGMSFSSFTLSATLTLTVNSLLTISSTLTINAAVTATFAGTAGFTCATLSRGSSTGATVYTLAAGNTYTITTALNMNTSNLAAASHSTIVCGTVNGTKAILTLRAGATQKLAGVNVTDIDCSGGQTLWSFDGVITRCTNVNSWTQPTTVGF